MATSSNNHLKAVSDNYEPEPRRFPVPERGIRYTRRAKAIGSILLVTAGVAAAGPSLVERFSPTPTASEIRDLGERAPAAFEAGEIDSSEASPITVSREQSTFGTAAQITEPGEDLRQTADLIDAQTGSRVEAGSEVIIPNDLLKDSLEQPARPNVIASPK